jgi:hypothetical protein
MLKKLNNKNELQNIKFWRVKSSSKLKLLTEFLVEPSTKNQVNVSQVGLHMTQTRYEHLQTKEPENTAR